MQPIRKKPDRLSKPVKFTIQLSPKPTFVCVLSAFIMQRIARIRVYFFVNLSIEPASGGKSAL